MNDNDAVWKDMLLAEAKLDQEIEKMRVEINAMDNRRFYGFCLQLQQIIDANIPCLPFTNLRARLANIGLEMVMIADERASLIQE